MAHRLQNVTDLTSRHLGPPLEVHLEARSSISSAENLAVTLACLLSALPASSHHNMRLGVRVPVLTALLCAATCEAFLIASRVPTAVARCLASTSPEVLMQAEPQGVGAWPGNQSPPGTAPTSYDYQGASTAALMEQLYLEYPECREMSQFQALEYIELGLYGEARRGPLKVRAASLVDCLTGLQGDSQGAQSDAWTNIQSPATSWTEL